jgi:soluble lytic murein transglycosylase-like protein
VIVRESRYNPRAIGAGGAMGLMQIKHATARGVGYSGSAAGLLDANTNLTYAVRYLAGAYRVANGNADRAVAYYASGYYYAAKRQRLARTTGQAASELTVARTGPSTTSAVHSRVVVGATPRMDAVH